MIGTLRSLLVLALVGAVAALAPPAATAGQTQTYIVVLQPGGASVRAEAASLSRQYGGDVGFVYEHALRGFSITASSGAAAGLARNPRVSYVEADQVVTVDAQSTPTGLGRIYAADSNSTTTETGYNQNLDIDGVDDRRVDVDVAVIDTGIDLGNPDLNVVAGISCLNVSQVSSCAGTGDDDHYHGTHVAGTIGALDNGIGVVGVAPGARLWAVKVLDSTGNGSDAGVIAGIDWVLAHNASSTDDIEVANLSLGGPKSTSLNAAVARAVDAGVSVAVAAGNSSANVANSSPASEPSAITVSALADFNGLPGGGAAYTCYPDVDDTFAGFSNYGSGVDLIAPGVCITSTNNNSTSLRTISGTSMASPHVAGAAALLRSMGKSLATTEAELKSTGNGNWSGDRDTVHEPLLDVSNTTVFNPTMVAGPGGGGGTNTPPSASFTSSCSGLTCSFTSTSTDTGGSIASSAWDFGDGGTSAATNPSHTYAAGGTYTVTLTVTDDGGLTGSTSQSVMVTAPTSGPTFSGSSSQGAKGTWTATVTVTNGTSGSAYSGAWSVGGSPNSCTADANGTCVINRTGIAKKTASVTWTYAGSPATVLTISKP